MDITRRATADGDTQFSRLEASLATAKVARRHNSIEMKDVNRHGGAEDANVNELDFNFSAASNCDGVGGLRSLQDVFTVVQYNHHLQNPRNFSEETQIQCFEAYETERKWHILGAGGLSDLLEQTRPRSPVKASRNRFQSKPQRLLAFFIPLIPAKDTSFGSRTSLSRSSTRTLFQTLNVNPLYLLNLLGRPDYWAPQTRFESDENGEVVACDFFCQHPRWNLHFQGAPLSVYMRYSRTTDLTTYIIAHRENDTSVSTLQNILRLAEDMSPAGRRAFIDDPFDIAVILSTLSLEASKFHVKKFQRFMWTSINKVDDHLAGMENSDRARLGELTKQLQIISQNADSHIANADVAIITANHIRSAHARLHVSVSLAPFAHQRVHDAIEYVIKSMEKQKIWFLNYKGRKDSTMNLVFNLVTQQDAANNIQLSASMKKDSTSMNAIAALTMVFLPGTFTASLTSSGIFHSEVGSNKIGISGVWWVWLVITIPLTGLTVMSWWIYKVQKERSAEVPTVTPQKKRSDSTAPRPWLTSFSSFSWQKQAQASVVEA